MTNEAHFSVIGFVATQPKAGFTKGGSRSVSMRVGWTPRSFDRGTGEWADQPSSFITVQCYKKVAEHVYVCLRRGDPVVVRGTLRVREFVDQQGVRRSSVEVMADSIGHDLSRGISLFTKTPAHVERTAAEQEQAMASEAVRSPLLGDRPAMESAAEHEQDPDESAELADVVEASELAEAEPGDGPDAEFGATGAFDDAVMKMMADGGDAPVPVGASA
jgi:single-strand DNA-binding protein